MERKPRSRIYLVKFLVSLLTVLAISLRRLVLFKLICSSTSFCQMEREVFSSVHQLFPAGRLSGWLLIGSATFSCLLSRLV
jgi:hypothetical protein